MNYEHTPKAFISLPDLDQRVRNLEVIAGLRPVPDDWQGGPVSAKAAEECAAQQSGEIGNPPTADIEPLQAAADVAQQTADDAQDKADDAKG